MMRPAAMALTTRVTRTVPKSSSTRTSQNTAECVARMYFVCFSTFGSIRYFSSMLVLARRVRMSRSGIAVPGRCASRSAPSTNSTSSKLRFGEAANPAGLRASLNSALLQLLAHALHRRADRRDVRRAALDRRHRQGRIAELERHLLQRQAHGGGGDLRHHRVGAGADVGGRAAHHQPAVGMQHRAGAREHLHRIPCAGGHAPADQFAAFPHGARRRRALRPAEALRALRVAGAQLLGGDRAGRSIGSRSA